MPEPYIPEQGDLVWLAFDPQAGHEQAGRRPALVLSPRSYNAKTGLALFCPITSQRKGYAFEVELPAGTEVSGVVLSDQIRSLDWRVRKAIHAGSSPAGILAEVMAKFTTLLPAYPMG
jgi:mRNA interferase MazF